MTERLVIAGARGAIADYTFQGLEKMGIAPVAVIDNNPSLWGQWVAGVRVMPPADAVREFPDALFVAAVSAHTPLRRQLAELGALNVTAYAGFFRKYHETFLPYFAVDVPSKLDQYADAVQAAADIWADEESQKLYGALVEWFRTLNSDSMPAPLPGGEEYFPDFLELRADEVFLDCGAFDGDTIRQYLQISRGKFSRVIAMEPDPSTFARLQGFLQTNPFRDRMNAINAAASHDSESVRFSATATALARSVSHDDKAAGAASVPGMRLDDILPCPTFVKMDIEGFQISALQGGRGLLRAGQTAWAVTVYHRVEDFWQVPLFIRSVAPQLRLFLRHYDEDWTATVCYALPASRLKAGKTS